MKLLKPVIIIYINCGPYNQVLYKFLVEEPNISINQNDNNAIMGINS